MNELDQMYEKRRAHEAEMQAKCADNANSAASTGVSALGGGVARPGLRDRVLNQKLSAERASRGASRLGELEYLLEKNPEVARILDLLEDVRG